MDYLSGSQTSSGRQIRVLITTPQWQSALACIQSLGRSGHSIYVWGNIDGHPNLKSKYIAKRLERTSKTIEGQIDELQEVVVNNKIDMVVPVTDQDAEVCARLNERMGRRICVVGSIEALQLIRDRNKTYDYCLSHGIVCPKSGNASLHDIHAVVDEIGYPCFIKLSGTVGSAGVFRISNDGDLAELSTKLDSSLIFQVQAEVVGHFSDITGFSVNGVLVSYFSFRTGYEHSHGGSPAYATEVHDAELKIVLEKIVEGIDWTGGIDIDLMTDAQGNHYVLEINPRLSGTSVFAYKVGVDLPQCYVDCFNEKQAVLATDRFDQPIARFVSLAEESYFLATKNNKKLPKLPVGRETMLDNSFPNDRPYNGALRRHKWKTFLAFRYPRLKSTYTFIKKAISGFWFTFSHIFLKIKNR